MTNMADNKRRDRCNDTTYPSIPSFQSNTRTTHKSFALATSCKAAMIFTIVMLATTLVTADDKFDQSLRGVSKANDDENNSGSSLPSWVVSQYGQDRSEKWLGTGPEYVLMNTYNDHVAKRQKEMDALNEIKEGACGGFEDHARSLSSSASTSSSPSSWQPVHDIDWKKSQYDDITPEIEDLKDDEVDTDLFLEKLLKTFLYCGSNIDFRNDDKANCKELPNVKRQFCRAPHPTRDGVTVSIERMGPFVTTGGYSWTSAQFMKGAQNIANMTSYLQENPSVSMIGGMVAPVYKNGSIAEYPPLHIHHAHIYPYGSRIERHKKIPGSMWDDHDLVFQSHGETACDADQGGKNCLLNILDEGEGYLIKDAATGISADWDVNDVRPKGSEPLEWYFEVVLMHKTKEEPKSVTYMGVNNPCVGMGPCTYAMPQDPNSNVMFYEYQHRHLSSGVMKNWVLHTHMHFADSAFFFKGHGVKKVMTDFVKSLNSEETGMPIILDCHGHTLESAKKAILEPIMEREDATLICEMTKTSLRFECDSTNDDCTGYDRRSHLNCLKEISIEPGEVIAMVAFNHIRLHNLKRTRNKDDNDNSNDEDLFATFQHSIFRADFYPHEGEGPPAYFIYADEDFIKSEGSIMDLDELERKTAKCPSSIRYAWDLERKEKKKLLNVMKIDYSKIGEEKKGLNVMKIDYSKIGEEKKGLNVMKIDRIEMSDEMDETKVSASWGELMDSSEIRDKDHIKKNDASEP